MLAQIVVKEGASKKARGMFHRSVVQSVLLYGVETWTVALAMMKMLASFHNQVAKQITGILAKRVQGEWVHSPVAPALEACDLHSIQECVWGWQRTMEEYVHGTATCPQGMCVSAAAHWLLRDAAMVATGPHARWTGRSP
jgi:hypothetical protein